MKQYKIKFFLKVTSTVTIHANSYEEAEDIAYSMTGYDIEEYDEKSCEIEDWEIIE